MALYIKKVPQEMREWTEGEDMTKIAVNQNDRDAFGSPKRGDMIAHDPKNAADQWLISKEFFDEHYIPLPLGSKEDAEKLSADEAKQRDEDQKRRMADAEKAQASAGDDKKKQEEAADKAKAANPAVAASPTSSGNTATTPSGRPASTSPPQDSSSGGAGAGPVKK